MTTTKKPQRKVLRRVKGSNTQRPKIVLKSTAKGCLFNVEKSPGFSGELPVSARAISLRVIVDDAALLKQDGFQRVTVSLLNCAAALAQVDGSRGCRRAADAWAAAFRSVLIPTGVAA